MPRSSKTKKFRSPQAAPVDSAHLSLLEYLDNYLGKVGCFFAHGQVSLTPDSLSELLLPCQLVYAAVWIYWQCSRRPPPQLPRYMQLQFQPLQLQRFLRGCVLATAHALAAPPASMFRIMHAKSKSRLIDCIFVRVMSGFAARAEQTLLGIRAAAEARVASKDGIHEAAYRGDVAAVQDYLIADASCVHERDWSQDTPLHRSASNGHVNVSELLLSFKADVNARDGHQRTPLLLYGKDRNGNCLLAKLLLSWNADVNARDNGRQSPLHNAAVNARTKVCKVLISAKADAAAKNDWGCTPLQYAISMCDEKHRDVFRFLRSVGAPDMS